MTSSFMTQDRVLAALKKLGASTIQELCIHLTGKWVHNNSDAIAIRARIGKLKKHGMIVKWVENGCTVYDANDFFKYKR